MCNVNKDTLMTAEPSLLRSPFSPAVSVANPQHYDNITVPIPISTVLILVYLPQPQGITCEIFFWRRPTYIRDCQPREAWYPVPFVPEVRSLGKKNWVFCHRNFWAVRNIFSISRPTTARIKRRRTSRSFDFFFFSSSRRQYFSMCTPYFGEPQGAHTRALGKIFSP